MAGVELCILGEVAPDDGGCVAPASARSSLVKGVVALMMYRPNPILVRAPGRRRAATTSARSTRR